MKSHREGNWTFRSVTADLKTEVISAYLQRSEAVTIGVGTAFLP